jgi:hypothetical protein
VLSKAQQTARRSAIFDEAVAQWIGDQGLDLARENLLDQAVFFADAEPDVARTLATAAGDPPAFFRDILVAASDGSKANSEEQVSPGGIILP